MLYYYVIIQLMVFPYQTSGYRSDRARSQAKAFEQPSPPVGGFVAPGFPVEVAPPPPPPPVFLPAAAAAGASSVALPLGALAAVVAGGALGLAVKRDIDKFKTKSKLPFYDDVYFARQYDESKPMKIGDYEQSEYSDPQLADWSEFSARIGPSILPANGFAPDGSYGAFQVDDLGDHYGLRYFVYEHCTKTGPVLGWKSRSSNTCVGTPGWGTAPNSDNCGASQLISGTYVGSPDDLFFCPANTNIASSEVMHLLDVTTGSGHRAQPDVIWHLTGLDYPGVGYPEALPGSLSPGVYPAGTMVDNFLPLSVPDQFARSWANSVATPGSQPSLEEQLADAKLPSGDVGRGYYVDLPVNYPWTLVQVAPGSPPVTVPDVVVQVSPGTEPLASLVPPSPPQYPSTVAGEHERKPWNRFRSAVGVFVNVATEVQDFLEAMHKGLPKKYRRKGAWGIVPDADVILGDILAHWSDWDADVAMEAFINNEIEDQLLGRFYFRNLPTRGARNVGGRLAGKIPLPQVHFANGEHSISIGDVVIEGKDQ